MEKTLIGSPKGWFGSLNLLTTMESQKGKCSLTHVWMGLLSKAESLSSSAVSYEEKGELEGY